MPRRRRPTTPAEMTARDAASIGPRQLKDPRSPAFAWQTLSLLQTFYESRRVSVERFEKVLAEAEAHRIYERIPEEAPFGSLEEMLRAELGVEGAAVAAGIVRAPTALDLLRRAWHRASAEERAAFRLEITEGAEQ